MAILYSNIQGIFLQVYDAIDVSHLDRTLLTYVQEAYVETLIHRD